MRRISDDILFMRFYIYKALNSFSLPSIQHVALFLAFVFYYFIKKRATTNQIQPKNYFFFLVLHHDVAVKEGRINQNYNFLWHYKRIMAVEDFHCNSRYDNQSTLFSEINQILNDTPKNDTIWWWVQVKTKAFIVESKTLSLKLSNDIDIKKYSTRFFCRSFLHVLAR